MNIKKLIDVVTKAESIVNDNSPYYVYRNIGLGIGDDGVSMLSTDGEITIQAWSTTHIKHRVAVQARVFSNAIKTIQGDVQLELRDNEVVVKSQDAEFRFALMDYDAMPMPQIYEKDDEFEASGIATLVRMVGTSASKEKARMLDAVYFDGVNAVSTDGIRMAVMAYAFPQKAILPIEPLRSVARLVGDDPVKVALSDAQVLFSTSDMRIWVQLYDNSRFLNYKSILRATDECDKVMHVNTADLIRSLRRAGLFSAYARLEIQNNRAVIHASGDLGSVRDQIDVDADFAVAVRFNVEYLIGLLTAAGSSNVTFRIKDNRSAVGIDDEYGWRSVIMPAFLEEDNVSHDETNEEVEI